MAALVFKISLHETTTPPLYKLNYKPLYSSKQFYTPIPNPSKRSYSSYNLLVTKSYRNGPSVSIANEEVENRTLCDDLRLELMPKHIVMIMDANHEVGYDADHGSLKDIVRICCELGIKVLSLYTNSFGIFHQPKEDVDFAMNITKLDLEELARNDIRVSVIGNRNVIPNPLREIVTQVEESTKNNKSLHVIEAIGYTGRSEILQACIAVAEKVKDGVILPSEVDENVFQQELETKWLEFPNPDLMIRTGGKHNVGNFMLWQLAYTELHFVGFEFNKIDFIEALTVYQKRQRRFGVN